MTSTTSVSPSQKTWFLTGASRGFGREWAIAALERGDRVAATARDTASLDDLVARFGDAILPIRLDVTDRAAGFAAVAEAHAQFETSVFGALWITQAAVPLLRAQGSGHIIQVSSIGGISAFPNIGIYNASKWALEGFSQALAAEVAEFGIHVTLIEPGGFSTDWSGDSARHASPIAAYDDARERRARQRAAMSAQAGDPTASAAAILRLVDAEQPPLRVFFGVAPFAIMQADYDARAAEWASWREVSELAQG